MKHLGYFEKLSLAARWFLPREEAEGIIDDYRDILFEVHGPEEAKERFGTPLELVRGLAEPKKVRSWHYFFAVMAFLVIAPCVVYFATYRRAGIQSGTRNLFICSIVFFAALWVILVGSYKKAVAAGLAVLLAGFTGFLYYCNPAKRLELLYCQLTNQWSGSVSILPYDYEIFSFFFLAALLSLAVFGLRNRLKKKMSKFLIISLCLVALGVAGVYGFCWYGAYVDMGLMLHLGWIKAGSLCAGGLCFAGALFSIVMARLYDRRWRAVMILCLAGLAMCIELHYLVWNWSASLWVLVRDYEAGNHDWIIPGIQDMASQFLIYIGAGSVLAAIGLV